MRCSFSKLTSEKIKIKINCPGFFTFARSIAFEVSTRTIIASMWSQIHIIIIYVRMRHEMGFIIYVRMSHEMGFIIYVRMPHEMGLGMPVFRLSDTSIYQNIIY